MNNIDPADAPPVDLTNPQVSAVHVAAADLASLKVTIDRLSRDKSCGIGQAFLDDWMDGANTCAYFGLAFLHRVLPFLRWEEERTASPSRFKALVSPRYVLGACIKGWPENIPPDDVSQRIRSYATFNEFNSAQYTWFNALGIFVAHEGKHRVAFMRAHEQPAIAAWVREADYPAPDRLTLIEPTDEADEWLILLDGRYLQVVCRPRVTCSILNAYGVATKRWEQFGGVPLKQVVRREIFERRLHRGPKTYSEGERTIDLDALKDQLLQVEPELFSTQRGRWKDLLLATGASIACIVVGALLVETIENHLVQVTGWVVVGAGLGVGLSIPRWGNRAQTSTHHGPLPG